MVMMGGMLETSPSIVHARCVPQNFGLFFHVSFKVCLYMPVKIIAGCISICMQRQTLKMS